MYNYYENMEKGLVYSYYIRIVDEIKPYEKITIKNMIEEVLKQYSYENFLYYLCTSKELDFLKKILDKKIDEEAHKAEALMRRNKRGWGYDYFNYITINPLYTEAW